MALIDDIEFYGRAVDAGELTRQKASELLARDSAGFLTIPAAVSWIDRWEGARTMLDRMYYDVTDAIRALENGRPIPAAIDARWAEQSRQRAREQALRVIRRPLRKPQSDWEDDPRSCARADDRYWDNRYDRDED